MSRLLDERGQPVRFQLHPALLVAQRGETPGQAYRRWVIEKAVDREFPLEEIASIVSEWRDLDDVGRQELLDLATSTRERALLEDRAA